MFAAESRSIGDCLLAAGLGALPGPLPVCPDRFFTMASFRGAAPDTQHAEPYILWF